MKAPRFEDYRFEIRPLSAEDGGGFLVTVPDLPGCMSDGDTYDEAIAKVRDAFEGWIETCRELGREVPLPDSEGKAAKFVLRLPRSLHQRVISAAAAEGVSANTLLTTFVAEGVAVREPRNSIAEPKAPRYRVKRRGASNGKREKLVR